MLSKACKYAIRTTLYLAIHSDSQARYSVKPLAENLEIPVHFLGKILQQMVREELISSIKGPGGGFYLTEVNRQVTLRQIVRTIDGPEIMEDCVLGFKQCSVKNPCALHSLYGAYRDGFFNLLGDQTVEEVAERLKRRDGNF
jgi:Rrf2 family protein